MFVAKILKCSYISRVDKIRGIVANVFYPTF